MKEKKYIILGLTPQGLALLRELGRVGADVTAFCQSKHNVGYSSRYGKKIFFRNVEELKEGIGEIVADSIRKPICYITSGEILALVLREYKELYELCEVSSAPYSVIEMLAHKDRMYAYACSHGLTTAKYITLDKYQNGMLSFPLFLKRNYEIPLFFKAAMIENMDQLEYYISRIPKESLKDVIAQEFINIPSSNLLNLSCQGYYVEGECCGLYLANQKRRLKKGLTSYIEEVTDFNIAQPIERLVRQFMLSLRYSGFAEFEFMYDVQNQRLYFIEVNTRVCGSQSGLHYKFSNLVDVLLFPQKKTQLIVKCDCLKWMNIVRDIRARFESNDFYNLTDLFHAHYDILRWDDIKPFLFQFIRI